MAQVLLLFLESDRGRVLHLVSALRRRKIDVGELTDVDADALEARLREAAEHSALLVFVGSSAADRHGFLPQARGQAQRFTSRCLELHLDAPLAAGLKVREQKPGPKVYIPAVAHISNRPGVLKGRNAPPLNHAVATILARLGGGTLRLPGGTRIVGRIAAGTPIAALNRDLGELGTFLPELGAPQEPPRSTPRGDRITLSAFARRTVASGATSIVRAFLHLPQHGEIARRMAQELDPAATRAGAQPLNTRAARGDLLRICIETSHGEVAEPAFTYRWLGEPIEAAFTLKAPTVRKPREVLIVLRVEHDGLPVGRLVFSVQIAPKAVTAAPLLQMGAFERYRSAFLSYASADRDVVQREAERWQAREGVECFMDVLSLRSGDRWLDEIKRRIAGADLFVLYWSPAAADSKWVAVETREALKARRRSPVADPDIKPYRIERGRKAAPVPAPESLSHLHFERLKAPLARQRPARVQQQKKRP